MTEKEKMMLQMLYDANNDTSLIEERQVAKDMCYDFNQLRPSDTAGQQRIMRQLLGKTAGNSFCIVAPFWCDYGYNIEIGENFFANHNTVILDGRMIYSKIYTTLSLYLSRLKCRALSELVLSNWVK